MPPARRQVLADDLKPIEKRRRFRWGLVVEALAAVAAALLIVQNGQCRHDGRSDAGAYSIDGASRASGRMDDSIVDAVQHQLRWSPRVPAKGFSDSSQDFGALRPIGLVMNVWAMGADSASYYTGMVLDVEDYHLVPSEEPGRWLNAAPKWGVGPVAMRITTLPEHTAGSGILRLRARLSS